MARSAKKAAKKSAKAASKRSAVKNTAKSASKSPAKGASKKTAPTQSAANKSAASKSSANKRSANKSAAKKASSSAPQKTAKQTSSKATKTGLARQRSDRRSDLRSDLRSEWSSFFSPLDDRLLVVREGVADRTPGGLFIPDTAEAGSRPSRGTVVAVGRGHRDKKGRLQPLDVKVDDLVLFERWAGSELELQGEQVVVLREKDVLGVQEA